MSAYIVGMVTPVPKRHLAAYRRLSRMFGKVWRAHGAIEYHECIGDDVSWGKRTSFPRSVKLQAREVVCLAWIVYRSRQHRDRVNAKAMKDPRVAPYMTTKKLPFDTKRLYFGGFKRFVAL